MKKIIFRSCVAILTIGLSSQSYTQAHEDPSIKDQSPVATNTQQATLVDYSAQIQALTTSLNNKKIQYIDGKSLIFADVSMLGIAALGAISLGLLAGGGACGTVALKNWDLKLVFPAAFFTGMGIGAGFVTIKTLIKRLKSEPYIILDRKGLNCEGKRKLEWRNVESVTIVQHSAILVQQRVIIQHDIFFKDRSDKIIFEISGEFKALSPETFLQMLQLIEYYRNQAFSLPANTPFATVIDA